MKKTIIITESELVKIVNKVISEQSSNVDCSININPLNLKYGDGGKSSINKQGDVKKLQKKLWDLKLLQLKNPNNPTGFFGEKTDAALKKYNEFCKNKKSDSTWIDKLKSLKIGLPTLPLHQQAALKFMRFSSEPTTEKNLSSDNLKVLSDIICQKAIRLKSCDPSKWGGVDKKGNQNKNFLGYHDMSTMNKNSPSFGRNSFTYEEQPSTIKELMFFLGGSTISKSGDGWLITDTYDFDKIFKYKPYLKADGFWEGTKNFLSGIYKGIKDTIQGKSATAGFEESLSQLHNTGYKGYPVKIQVPSYGCKCKS